MNATTQTPAQKQTQIDREHIAAISERLNQRESAGKIDSEHLKDLNRQLSYILESLN